MYERKYACILVFIILKRTFHVLFHWIVTFVPALSLAHLFIYSQYLTGPVSEHWVRGVTSIYLYELELKNNSETTNETQKKKTVHKDCKNTDQNFRMYKQKYSAINLNPRIVFEKQQRKVIEKDKLRKQRNQRDS